MMKKTYHLEDGGTITASSPSEFVELLRKGSLFASDSTDDQYMRDFADRYMQMHGREVDCSSPDTFLDSLVSHGYAILS